MGRSYFSTDELPPHLDDRARFLFWRDLVEESLGGPFDVSRTPDRPFSMQCGLLRFGTTVLAHLSGTITRMGSSRNMLSVVGSDNFCLNMNLGRGAMGLSQPGRQVVLERKTAALLVLSGRAELQAGHDGELNYSTLIVPRIPLRELAVNVEDLLATAIDPRLPALRHLQRYLQIVSEPGALRSDAALIEHIDTTILDLVALTLGAGRDAREIARMRGLRAARLQEVLAEIRASFADATFAPIDVARKLGMSPRYVQELLQETGSTFTERVLELRLQKARATLAKFRHDRLKVSDIAFACGFNEVSYFNRCFRRRFGVAPSDCRGGRQPLGSLCEDAPTKPQDMAKSGS